MAIMEIAKIEVKSTSTFLFKELYVSLYRFILEEGYAAGADADFPEKYYWEARGHHGREFWIWWRCKSTTDTGFVNKIMDIDIHGVGVTDVEIMYEGKKIKANKGKLEVIIRSKLEIDPGDEWKNGSLGFLRDFYYKRFWRKELLKYKDDLVEDMHTFRDFCASFMKKSMINLRPEPFHPKLGLERDKF